MRPRLLDLFCCAAGAAMGYHRAGFDVVGVDLEPQPRYPFAFVQADALEYLAAHGREFDAVHASPPCQDYSAMKVLTNRAHDRLIAATFTALRALGRPFAVENVEGARRDMPNALTLCGTQFGLRVRRHRLFVVEPASLALLPECDCHHGVVTGRLIGHRLAGPKPPGRRVPPVFKPSELRAAMGCDWMTTEEMRQAIPPAYTAHIGAQLLAALSARVAA